MRGFKVVIDADDVLLSCNDYALELLKKDTGKECSVNEIDGWGILGKPVDERLRYFDDPQFFSTQPAMEGAGGFLKRVSEMADVTIMTAVNPKFAGMRIERLQKLFPFFSASQVVMGERKDLLNADVILDDRVKNVMSSGCALPVLYRRPWNQKMSGFCSVSGYDEFIDIVSYLQNGKANETKGNGIVCIVGPAGSSKHRLLNEICMKDGSFEPVVHITTAESCEHPGTMTVTGEEFDSFENRGLLAEKTWYDNERYGTFSGDFEEILARGKNAVTVMDISGSISMRRRFPDKCLIVYADRNKYDAVREIIGKDLSDKQKTDRICGIDHEQKNRVLADIEADTDDDQIRTSAEKICGIFRS